MVRFRAELAAFMVSGLHLENDDERPAIACPNPHACFTIQDAFVRSLLPCHHQAGVVAANPYHYPYPTVIRRIYQSGKAWNPLDFSKARPLIRNSSSDG